MASSSNAKDLNAEDFDEEDDDDYVPSSDESTEFSDDDFGSDMSGVSVDPDENEYIPSTMDKTLVDPFLNDLEGHNTRRCKNENIVPPMKEKKPPGRPKNPNSEERRKRKKASETSGGKATETSGGKGKKTSETRQNVGEQGVPPMQFPESQVRQSLVDDLHSTGFKAIWMLDPGIKHEKGKVWPGPCVFPDFTQEKARSWWANLVKDFISNGVDGIWNDMNEPAVFKSITKTMPESNIHRGDTELGGHQNHLHYHNVYGMLMARSTYEGMKLANPNKRPFVLTRAGFIGSQRYAAAWTGDNHSTWEHLHMSISMGLSGQPLSGQILVDLQEMQHPNYLEDGLVWGPCFHFVVGILKRELLTMSLGYLGKRLALKRRYRFIPHIYTLFYLAHTRGSPVASPTFLADLKDPQLRRNENSFLLGPLLAYCSTMSDLGVHEIQHTLPNGTWMSFDFKDSHPDLPALYLRDGSIIPFGPAHQHVGEANLNDDMSLFVALDENGKAEGVLYEDDGDGYEYTNGAQLLTTYIAEVKSSVVTVRVSKTKGLWTGPNRRLQVHILLGEGAMVDAWGTDGKDIQITMPSENEVLDLISEYKQHIRESMCW
ncbi:hypothetical protein L2E82_42050 [Cichorium intybus]|uniref:Uncharacterized protein n=1 Tax=Cichorium intybus TaxID=13427 RepID=A0ACB8ZLV3_CICIN|nr:hypothetical protein L2E82_42050 [Cichorium intybus]